MNLVRLTIGRVLDLLQVVQIEPYAGTIVPAGTYVRGILRLVPDMSS